MMTGTTSSAGPTMRDAVKACMKKLLHTELVSGELPKLDYVSLRVHEDIKFYVVDPSTRRVLKELKSTPPASQYFEYYSGLYRVDDNYANALSMAFTEFYRTELANRNTNTNGTPNNAASPSNANPSSPSSPSRSSPSEWLSRRRRGSSENGAILLMLLFYTFVIVFAVSLMSARASAKRRSVDAQHASRRADEEEGLLEGGQQNVYYGYPRESENMAAQGGSADRRRRKYFKKYGGGRGRAGAGGAVPPTRVLEFEEDTITPSSHQQSTPGSIQNSAQQNVLYPTVGEQERQQQTQQTQQSDGFSDEEESDGVVMLPSSHQAMVQGDRIAAPESGLSSVQGRALEQPQSSHYQYIASQQFPVAQRSYVQVQAVPAFQMPQAHAPAMPAPAQQPDAEDDHSDDDEDGAPRYYFRDSRPAVRL